MADKSDKPDKIVLAFSGGLDTSVAVRWLKEEYGSDIVTFTVDLGMVDLEPVKKKALRIGAVEALVADAKEEFYSDYICPALRAGAIYEEQYPLATALGRPLIAQRISCKRPVKWAPLRWPTAAPARATTRCALTLGWAHWPPT